MYILLYVLFTCYIIFIWFFCNAHVFLMYNLILDRILSDILSFIKQFHFYYNKKSINRECYLRLLNIIFKYTPKMSLIIIITVSYKPMVMAIKFLR